MKHPNSGAEQTPFATAPETPEAEAAALLLLGHTYLEAGLRPDHAWQSAVADYRCSFDGVALCLR